MNEIKIAWLYPDTLYLHGERGNILALVKIGDDLGLDIKVNNIHLQEEFNPDDFDIIYCPAGELKRAKNVISHLDKEALEAFVKAGKPLIVTGNSLAFFGNNIKRLSGETIKGLGLIDIDSKENEAIYGDDIYYKTKYHDKDLEIIGNQIQMVDIESIDEPFGHLLYGYGNNGKDRFEGVIKNNSIFTNTLGPLLVLNPWLTEEILKVAAENKNIETNDNLNFDLETKSFNSKLNYIKNKKTNLKNCNTLE